MTLNLERVSAQLRGTRKDLIASSLAGGIVVVASSIRKKCPRNLKFVTKGLNLSGPILKPHLMVHQSMNSTMFAWICIWFGMLLGLKKQMSSIYRIAMSVISLKGHCSELSSQFLYLRNSIIEDWEYVSSVAFCPIKQELTQPIGSFVKL